jgi:hypothetical protein
MSVPSAVEIPSHWLRGLDTLVRLFAQGRSIRATKYSRDLGLTPSSFFYFHCTRQPIYPANGNSAYCTCQ